MKNFFFAFFFQLTNQVGMKNVVKCYKDFFGYFNALKTHSERSDEVRLYWWNHQFYKVPRKNLIDFCPESLFRLGTLCTNLSGVTLRIIKTNHIHVSTVNFRSTKLFKWKRISNIIHQIVLGLNHKFWCFMIARPLFTLAHFFSLMSNINKGV